MLIIKRSSTIICMAIAVIVSCQHLYCGEQEVPTFVTEFLKGADFDVTRTYYNGFEKQVDFDGFYITPQKHLGSTSHTLTDVNVFKGKYAHKAWMHGTNRVVPGKNTNHRGYPTFQMEKTPLGILKEQVLVDFWAWVDVDLFKKKEHRNWLSLATFTSYSGTHWIRSYLVNLDEDYQLHLMHVPHQGAKRPDIYQDTKTRFPKKEWVRVTVFIDYTKENRFDSPMLAVWQNGELMSASRFNDRIDPTLIDKKDWPKALRKWDGKDLAAGEKLFGLEYHGGLTQVHLGLYAPPLLKSGTICNDELKIMALKRKKKVSTK